MRSKQVKLFLFLIYRIFFCSAPNRYRPYSFGLYRVRNYLIKNALDHCGTDINVGKDCDFSPSIKVGDRSSLGDRCIIQNGVSIGNDVMMGPDVKIYTRNHVVNNIHIPMQAQGTSFKPVTIGNDVWIACNVVILPGVTIGSHSVIGAGAIVTRNVPDYAVALGNPARIAKYRANSATEDQVD